MIQMQVLYVSLRAFRGTWEPWELQTSPFHGDFGCSEDLTLNQLEVGEGGDSPGEKQKSFSIFFPPQRHKGPWPRILQRQTGPFGFIFIREGHKPAKSKKLTIKIVKSNVH